jgi:hypothetical protein
LFIGLAALYMFGTASGRRTSGKAYFLSALLVPPILAVLVFAALSLNLSYDAFTLVEALSNGFWVGFGVGGSAAMPLWASFLLWWLGIPAALVALVGIRSLIRARKGS